MKYKDCFWIIILFRMISFGWGILMEFINNRVIMNFNDFEDDKNL